jgi:hypothetical protein
MNKQARFKIGDKFKPVGRKHAQIHTVTDILKVINSKGEIVKIYYQSEHEFCGQKITTNEVCETTIARGFIK